MFSTPDFLFLFFMVFSLVLCNSLTVILIKYHSTIFYIDRNIFIYLNTSLIITMNIMVNEQCVSLLLRISYGPLPSPYATVARSIVMSSFLVLHGIVLTLNIIRIMLICKVMNLTNILLTTYYQPATFYNLNHEKTFHRIFGFLFFIVFSLLSIEYVHRIMNSNGKSLIRI